MKFILVLKLCTVVASSWTTGLPGQCIAFKEDHSLVLDSKEECYYVAAATLRGGLQQYYYRGQDRSWAVWINEVQSWKCVEK